MSFVQRRLLKLVLAVVWRPRLTLLICGLLLVISLGFTLSFLTISSDQNKLFSPTVPFFRDYLNFIQKFPENEAVYIVIEPRNPGDNPPVARWTAVADVVTDRMQSLHDYVVDAQCKIPLASLGRQGILFEDPRKLPAEFDDAGQLVPLAQFWGEAPTGVSGLLGKSPIERLLAGAVAQPDAKTAGFVGMLADSWTQTLRHPESPVQVVDLSAAGDPSRLGYFYVPDETNRSHYRILVRVYPTRIFNSLTSVTRTVDAIRAGAVDAAAAFPEFNVGVTGRPALDADQMRTTDNDSHHAEIVALIAVFIGLAVMLRSVWLAIAAELALGVGIGWTFGYATLAVGELNLLSLVFLIALIGIGMDYLVQILSRYRLEARRYSRAEAVWTRVFRYVGPPINTACLGAAGAFFVSVFTDFRGAADLGIIAGGGLILCLAAGYIVLPALLTVFPPKLRPYDVTRRYPRHPRLTGAGRLGLPVVWAAALLLLSPYMEKTQFNSGLIELQVPNHESVRLIRTLQTWSAVVLSKDLDELRRVRERVSNLPSVASTESALDAFDNAAWLKAHANEFPEIHWADPAPVTAADAPAIAGKARNLANVFDANQHPQAAGSLRAFADAVQALPMGDRLWQWQTLFIAELRGLLARFSPPAPDIAALPPSLRDHLISPDGYYALYIYPAKDLWDGKNLAQFTTEVESAAGKTPVTGIASNVFHTTGAIHRAFYQSTIYALVLIFMLVLLDFRRLAPTLAAISVLALGLPMLVGLMGVFHVDWNFANFFGLPILIGAGHEYGVFMVHRFLEAKRFPRRVWNRWDVSDRALLLCGFITSSSFGFFWWMSQHAGLKSLGLVMALGTACIYLSAVMVVRPILRWRLRRFWESRLAAQAPEPAGETIQG